MKQCKLEVLSRSINGKIFKCHTCNKIHIEYKNLNFTFSENEYHFFKDYFLKLEPEKWERINQNTFYKKKIMVPIGHRNFTAMFNTEEIYEIKNMFTGIKQQNVGISFIDANKIFVKPCLN
jgi:hypothetical protein